jgi:hypothetical protein
VVVVYTIISQKKGRGRGKHTDSGGKNGGKEKGENEKKQKSPYACVGVMCYHEVRCSWMFGTDWSQLNRVCVPKEGENGKCR